VVEAIESAKASIGSNSVIISSAVPEVSIELQRVDVVASQSAHTANKYKKFELPPWRSQAQLHEAPISQLVQLIRSVVANESPVHETDVTKRLLKAFGLSRAGNRIADVISEATRSGHRTGVFHYEGGFLYKDSQRSAVIRNRSDLESSERKIELVAPEELEAALLEIIQNSFSIERSAAISSALDLLGFGRATTNIASAMNDRLDQLIQRNLIKLDGDRLLPA
jgi:hypothetical protein